MEVKIYGFDRSFLHDTTDADPFVIDMVRAQDYLKAEAEVARLNEQVQALAAEVTAVKDAIPKLKDVEYENDNMDDVSLAEDIGFNDAVTLTNSRIPETPTTDAILREVGARAVDAFMAWSNSHIDPGDEHEESLREVSKACKAFAARIRAGEVPNA